MTKEQFLNGTSFLIPEKATVGSNSYAYEIGSIVQEYRNVKGEVMFKVYEANVSKIGRTGFEAYNFVLGKKVKVKYKFEDLREVE